MPLVKKLKINYWHIVAHETVKSKAAQLKEMVYRLMSDLHYASQTNPNDYLLRRYSEETRILRDLDA